LTWAETKGSGAEFGWRAWGGALHFLNIKNPMFMSSKSGDLKIYKFGGKGGKSLRRINFTIEV
jgi:hypothetical protein